NQNYLMLSQMTGGDDVLFLYDDGKIIKGVGDSSSDHSNYDDAFQVFYGENGLVKQVIEAAHGTFEKPTDFSFDLTSDDYYIDEIYNYHYEGDRLESITNKNGDLIMEFTYNSDGFITELYEAE